MTTTPDVTKYRADDGDLLPSPNRCGWWTGLDGRGGYLITRVQLCGDSPVCAEWAQGCPRAWGDLT